MAIEEYINKINATENITDLILILNQIVKDPEMGKEEYHRIKTHAANKFSKVVKEKV